MASTVLLTGFEPFNNETVNPAWEAVRSLAGSSGQGYAVRVMQLPCVFGEANRVLGEAITELCPVLVVAVGQAGGRADLSVERVAINVDQAPWPDNAQRQPVAAAVAEGGPAAYFSTLPVKAIVRGLRTAGLPASVSKTAGTFVCNHVFYGLMHRTAGTAIRAGFIHLPYLPEQAALHPGTASMSLADMVMGLGIAVDVAMARKKR